MTKRILVVDDAEVMRLILKDTLTIKGFEVVGEAANGEEAVELYKQLRPDVVTMDLIMPGVDGFQALKEIREFDNKAKVIVISALDQKRALLDAVKLGASDYIIKPFEPDRVEAAIKAALTKEE